MGFQLSIPGILFPEVTSKLPDSYRGPVIRGAIVKALNFQQQEIIAQEMYCGEFVLRLISGTSVKKFEIKETNLHDALRVSFILKNGIRKRIGNTDKIHTRKHHYMLCYSGSNNNIILIDNESEFQFLDIFYARDVLHEHVSCFPKLDQVMQSKAVTIIGKKSYWTSPAIREIYMQIINCDYDENLRQLYFGLKVRELLFHVLKGSLDLSISAPQFTRYEIARIHEAKSILETYIDKKPPSIRELSKMVAINEFKLKYGFRKFFDSGIFEWVTTEKMHHAKKMLEETNKPIKEIAALSGYPRITNFITAFRKQFGITPGAIRRS